MCSYSNKTYEQKYYLFHGVRNTTCLVLSTSVIDFLDKYRLEGLKCATAITRLKSKCMYFVPWLCFLRSMCIGVSYICYTSAYWVSKGSCNSPKHEQDLRLETTADIERFQTRVSYYQNET